MTVDLGVGPAMASATNVADPSMITRVSGSSTALEAIDLSFAVPEAVPLVRWSVLGYTPNGWAYRNVHTRGERFVAGVTSRQVGKTTTGESWIDESMKAPAHPVFGAAAAGVLSFDYAHAWLPVERWLARVRRADGMDRYYVNKNEHIIRDRETGAELRWFSADDPFAIAGYTLSDLLIDESQKVPDDVWGKARPTLNVRQARVLAFGTPDTTPDQTWFRGLYERGQEPSETNYHSFTVSCFENRWITLDEIRDARESLTEDEFRMLYLGQWVKLEGTVFRHFKSCFAGDWAEPRTGGSYIISVDLAKENDYTVAYVWDAAVNAVVHEFRINQLDYTEVEDSLERLYKHYNANYIAVDTTREIGVGDALRKRGLIVRPFVFTVKSKGQLVSNLARMLEHQQITLPRGAEGLQREIEVYTRKVTPSGNVQFMAPINYFDDRVMALGIGALQLRHGGNVYASRGGSDNSYVSFGPGGSSW